MNIWMSMKAALTVMDLVTRGWARQLGLDECGLMVLMLLSQTEEPRPGAELALLCGRARQQVHRSLLAMHELKLVRPAAVSHRGFTTAWALTAKGKFRAGCLARAIRAWEETLERNIDVPQLTEALGRVVETAVNRPGGDGWRKGLLIPHDLKIVPLWFEVEMEEGLLEEELVEPPIEEDDPSREERVRERAARGWNAMWMRISS